MKRFSFKLESVLGYRRVLEDREAQKLKGIHESVLEAERLRESLAIKVGNYAQMLAERSHGDIDIEKIRNLAGYLERLRQELVQASAALTKLQQQRRLQIESLMQARKSREVVEKLKENSLSLHTKEAHELEQKLLDELSVTQFGRLAGQDLPDVKPDAQD
jgi:flagellar export protein FliJ